MTNSLRRDLGLSESVAVGLGAIVGAGLFVVSGVAAAVAGPGLLVGVLIAGFAATCNALSSAQLAAAYPYSGGTYDYGYRLLHPWLGFAAGWLFLLSKLAAGGTVALGLALYLNRFIPSIDPRITATCIVLFLVVANLLGIRRVGKLNIAIVAVTLTTLVIFVVVAAPQTEVHHFRPFVPFGAPGIWESAGLMFFAFTGYGRLATLGEEVREPKTTIPRAIVVSLCVAIAVYIAVIACGIGTIGSDRLSESSSPIEFAARVVGGEWVAVVVLIGAATAMLGVLLSQLLAISRMFFAMARNGDMPRAFERISTRASVPFFGVIVAGSIAIGFVWLGALSSNVSIASFSILLYYAVANAAALKMQRTERLFAPSIPASGLILCIAMAAGLSLQSILIGTGVLVAGVLFRLVIRQFS